MCISAFPSNFIDYFWLYHDFLILRCFLLPKKDRKCHSVVDLELLNVIGKKISVSMCSTLPLAASSLPSLISFVPCSEAYILTHFYQNKYFQITCRSLSQQTGVQNLAQSLFPYSCLSFGYRSSSGLRFLHFSLCIGCKKENVEWGRAASTASTQPEQY